MSEGRIILLAVVLLCLVVIAGSAWTMALIEVISRSLS